MDNFMDKLAQKWNAAELIKANSAAEAMELKRLRDQVAEYEAILQEMRKVNLSNSELTNTSKLLLEEGIQELVALIEQEKNAPTSDVVQVVKDSFVETQECIHAENVKVYRNVQAVVVDGFKNQAEIMNGKSIELKKENEILQKKCRGIKPLIIILLLVSLVNTGLIVVQILGIL